MKKCVILVLSLLLMMSCKLSPDNSTDNDNGGSTPSKPEVETINKGACGETKDTKGVEVIEIDGKKYYYKEENYYTYPEKTIKENKDRKIEDDTLFRQILVKKWTEWLPGEYRDDIATSFTEKFEKNSDICYVRGNKGKYSITTAGTSYYCFFSFGGRSQDFNIRRLNKKGYSCDQDDNSYTRLTELM